MTLSNVTPCNYKEFEAVKGEIRKEEIEIAITQLNEGIKNENIYDEFYEGEVTLIYKKLKVETCGIIFV